MLLLHIIHTEYLPKIHMTGPTVLVLQTKCNSVFFSSVLTDEKLKIIRQATDYSVEVDTGRTALLPGQREIQKDCNHSDKQMN